jgi:tetratricopeptide (TPR) repeat protein
LADFDRAIKSEPSKIANYATRASIYQAQGKNELAVADLRKATDLVPKNIFDTAAQANAKKRMEELAKHMPCGAADRSCL